MSSPTGKSALEVALNGTKVQSEFQTGKPWVSVNGPGQVPLKRLYIPSDREDKLTTDAPLKNQNDQPVMRHMQHLSETNKENDRKYEEYRAELRAREENMGNNNIGKSCTYECYEPWGPGSPIGGRDKVQKALDTVQERMSEASPANKDYDAAEQACSDFIKMLDDAIGRRMGNRLDGTRPSPREHPLLPEITRQRMELLDCTRVICTLKEKYPKNRETGEVKVGSVRLGWDSSKCMLMCDGVARLSAQDNVVKFFSGTTTQSFEVVVRTTGDKVEAEKPEFAQAWARNVLGDGGLGVAAPWHGEQMEGHTIHDAAANWNDLMRWVGAPRIISMLFTYDSPSARAARLRQEVATTRSSDQTA